MLQVALFHRPSEKAPKGSIVRPADTLNPLWLVPRPVAAVGGGEVVEERLDVMLGYEADVRWDACAICPPQKAADFSAVVFDRLGSSGDL